MAVAAVTVAPTGAGGGPPGPTTVRKQKTILLYGDSGDGKTALTGEMAEWIYRTEQRRTRLASADRGGLETIRPYVDLGLIEVEELGDLDPWIWLTKVVRGYRRVGGKWILDAKANAQIGLWAFEGLKSVSDALMQSLARKASEGVNVGGGGNVNFNITADGETLKVGGNNQAHYGVVQTQVVNEVWQSQRLEGWVLWTSAAQRDDDPNAAGKIIGPSSAGKALTGEWPRFFVYCARVAALPAAGTTPERHLLYLGDHQDLHSGGAKGLGNTRVPLDAPRLQATIEPASLVKAIELIQASAVQATDVIRKRVGL